MALSQLLQALERETDLREREVRDAAVAAATRIRAEGAAALAGRRATDLALAESRHREASATAIAAARRAAAAAVLAARAEALARIRARAEALVAGTLPERAVAGVLDRELAGALAYFGDGPVAIHCCTAWRTAFTQRAGGGVGHEIVIDDRLGPGAMLHSTDGRLSVDATLAARLARRWPELAIGLVRELEATP